MKLSLGTKKCLWCGKEIPLKIRRDLIRKKFCSYGCRQKWRFENGEWTMDKMWERCNTPEANKKKSLKREKNPRWLGDRKLLKRPMCSVEGKIWRLSVYERDNFACQKCGQRGGKLQAHHIKGYFEDKENRWNIDNGITLCIKCHKKTDNYGWKSINIRKKCHHLNQ